MRKQGRRVLPQTHMRSARSTELASSKTIPCAFSLLNLAYSPNVVMAGVRQRKSACAIRLENIMRMKARSTALLVTYSAQLMRPVATSRSASSSGFWSWSQSSWRIRESLECKSLIPVVATLPRQTASQNAREFGSFHGPDLIGSAFASGFPSRHSKATTSPVTSYPRTTRGRYRDTNNMPSLERSQTRRPISSMHSAKLSTATLDGPETRIGPKH